MLSIAIAVVIASAPARVQDTSVHVTFQARAGRASEVLKSLGQAVKMDFQTSPVMENEVLVISVKDVPLSDLMARIATATSGEWKQEGATYRLIASTTIRRQEERADFDKKLEKITKALASRAAAEKKHDEMVAAEEKKAAAAAKTAKTAKTATSTAAQTLAKGKTGDDTGDDEPDGNPMDGGMNWAEQEMFTKLYRELDPNLLAQIQPGNRLVFSTDPTRAQHSLGGNATAAINEFIQKHNATVVEMPVETDSQDTEGMSKEQMDMMRAMMRRQNGKIGQIAKALLVFSQPEMGMLGNFGGGMGSQVELRLYDAKGNVAFSANGTLEDLSNYVEMMAMQDKGDQARAVPVNGGNGDDMSDDMDNVIDGVPPGAPQKAPEKGTPIEYSDDSKALTKATGALTGTTSSFRLEISDQLRRKLFLPNQYDPLSYSTTDELLAYAKAKGKPFVADVPDSWYGMSPFGGRNNNGTVESVTRRIEKLKALQVVADPGFTVIKATDPVEARETRMNRSAMATLLRASEEKSVPSLDDLAAFAMNSPTPLTGDLTQSYMMIFVPTSLMEVFGGQGSSYWNMLRFYGALSPEQRSTLGSGGKLALGTLTASERSEIEQLTYSAPVHLKVDDGKPPKDDNPLLGMMDEAMNMYGETDYRTEPTEVAPAGLPSSGYIEVQTNTEPFGSPISIPGSLNAGVIGILGTTEMAFFQMMKSAPGGDAGGKMPPLGKLRIGQQTQLKFTIRLAPQVIIRERLTDNRLAKDAAVFDENSLPADFQKRIADRLAAMKSGGMGGMFGAMGGVGEQIHP